MHLGYTNLYFTNHSTPARRGHYFSNSILVFVFFVAIKFSWLGQINEYKLEHIFQNLQFNMA